MKVGRDEVQKKYWNRVVRDGKKERRKCLKGVKERDGGGGIVEEQWG